MKNAHFAIIAAILAIAFVATNVRPEEFAIERSGGGGRGTPVAAPLGTSSGPVVVVYFDEALTQRTLCLVPPGDTIVAYVVAENFPKPIVSIEYAVMYGECEYVSEEAVGGTATGTASAGIKIDFPSPRDASNQLLVERIRLVAACSGGCDVAGYWQAVAPYNYPPTQSLRAFEADGWAVSAIGHAGFACANGAPDFEIASFGAPASAMLNENIASLLSLTLTNAGTDTVQEYTSFLVEYRISTDTIFTSSDPRIGYRNVPGSIWPDGESRAITVLTARIPLNAPKGNVYIGTIVDPINSSGTSNIKELDETNNVSFLPITIVPDPSIDTTCVYAEDFQDGDGGWTAKDLTYGGDSRWTWHDESLGIQGVMWCGTNDAAYATPPGYGNNWTENLAKTFTLASASTFVSYRIQWDVEPDYDFVLVQYSTDGSTFTTLEALTGPSSGFEQRSVSIPGAVGLEITIRFRVESDGSYSDEDGDYDSNGACRLDWIEVTGHLRDNFASGTDGWSAGGLAPVGGAFRLVYDPIYYPAVPGDWDYATGKLRRTCNAWVSYDPVTEQFPFPSPADSANGRYVDIAIESPEIPIVTDALFYELDYDVYSALPLTSNVFYTWYISFPPYTSWVNRSLLYYGTGGWFTSKQDITSLMQVGATAMKIRLVGRQVSGMGGTEGPHTPSPTFDNVKLVWVRTSMPGVDVSGFPRDCEPADEDRDGVGDLTDACPAEASSFFDRDGDGCIAGPIGARHIEYLATDTLKYRIHETGAPGIGDGSDITAVREGVDTWDGLPGSTMRTHYLGTTTQRDAQALDGVNLVTFTDPDFVFPTGVLGVGITTSYIEPDHYFNGRPVLPGQIVDCDIIFNPLVQFRTPTGGTGVDLRSVSVHEAGHLFGLSHSAVRTSTMFYVLPPDTLAASLEIEDRLALFKAYPDEAALAAASRLAGTVTDGRTAAPVPGAIVFAIEAASGDTLGSEYTLLDGSFEFAGLPAGEYYVSIYPLNGSSVIGYLQPGNVNQLVLDNAVTLFVPEWYDAAESATDDPSARAAVTVADGSTASIAIVTNIDEIGPTVLACNPGDGQTNVRIDASILVSFSEPIDLASVPGNFRIVDTLSLASVGGNAALVQDDSTLAFLPTNNLAFERVYRLELDQGITDKFGNGLDGDYELSFATEIKPDVAISSLAPRKGVEGALVVVSGDGFEQSLANNVVDFNGAIATILEATSTRLLVTVPPDATTGNVTVTNVAEGKTSNAIQFSVLSADEVARGYEAGVSQLAATPRAVSVAPDGAVAFVATDAGYAAVLVDPDDPLYLSNRSFPVQSGLDEIAVAPDGRRAYGVGRRNGALYRINAERGAGGLDDLAILSEMSVGAEPLGILIEPSGKRAFIPTSGDEIQIWDINPASATFDRRVGGIDLSGASLRGKLAIDPAGKSLLALSGGGALIVYDLAGDSLRAEIDVGGDPRDLAVDPMGERCYVTDDGGLVTIVSLELLAKVVDVTTGGSLRAAAVTPAGSFLYAVNRELNIYDVVDLRPESMTYRAVAADIPLRVNPVDAEMAPDGLYLYSVSEQDRSLAATAIGVGPVLRAVHPAAGPPGAIVVLTGSDFAGDETIAVSFGGAEAAPVVRRDSMIVAVVPPGAQSGAVTVVGRNAFKPDAPSNEIYFRVLGASTNDALRLAAKLGADGAAIGSAAAVSPAGRVLVYAAGGSGDQALRALDIDPASGTLHQTIGEINFGGALAVDEAIITPDGRRALVLDRGAGSIGEPGHLPIVDLVPRSPAFMTVLDSIDVSALVEGVTAACVSPDGSICLAAESADPGSSTPASVHAYNLDTFAGNTGSGVGEEALSVAGDVGALAYHPAGLHCYLAVSDGVDGSIHVLDADPASVTFLDGVANIPLPGLTPQSLSFTPDGKRCLVLAVDPGTGERSVIMLMTTNPASPASSVAVPVAAGGGGGRVAVSPAGDRAMLAYEGSGLVHLDVDIDPDAISVVGSAAPGTTIAAAGYPPDASRFYGAAPAEDSLLVYDFSAAAGLAAISGDGQSGVVNQPLPAPLRVRVTTSGGAGAGGIPVTFEVTGGGGSFAGSGGAVQVVATDATGAARADWTLGAVEGAQSVRVASGGLAGSPLEFTAVGLVDPETMPLRFVDVVPVDSSIQVSVTTAVQTVFSRALDPLSVDSTKFCLREEGAALPIAAVIGLADDNRKLSITPRAPLKASTVYLVQTTGGLQDASGGPLENPRTTRFRTAPPPPLVLSAASPRSSARGVPVVFSGTGFDAATLANNVVQFDDAQAMVMDASSDYVSVVVPYDATQGSSLVRVAVGAQTSNVLSFNVLAPETIAVDKEVIANVGTGSSTKSVAVTPDGARLYAVSPMMNLVVCVDVWSFRALPAIPVGENPHTIRIHPAGTHAYVTNFLDNTVSVIDISAVSPEYNRVVETIPVGLGPLDALVSPDGDRLIVSNVYSRSLSIVDTDEHSATFNRVLATVSTGQTTRSVAVTPDGGYIYLGTKDGYLVVDLVDYGVVATVGTGASTKSVAVTPDGAFLILLTVQGDVLIYDIAPGSPRENQVVGSVSTGSTVKSVAVTPDGGMLYVLVEQLDAIYCLRLSHVSSAGALAGPERMGPDLVTATPVDTIYAGEDPAMMAFAPNGTGIAVVTNAGDNTVSIFNPYSQPIAVALSELSVRPVDRGAVLAWRTLNEENLVGFVVSRSDGNAGEFALITAQTIPARGGPASYSYTDERLRPGVRYVYKLAAIDRAGRSTELGTADLTPAARFALEQNVPNPFNPSTRLRFSLAEAGHVRLVVYDVLGRRVRTLLDRSLPADHYEIAWDGRNNDGVRVASGVYFCRLESGKSKATRKMVLLR
ncbi:MAG: T9SS C-terminal target domain-containing protein [Candidatus Latescibacterota bacterium]|nr:MAG: T9SS C-terminal target domain-containing protein [Candidatus Latescibacterota bacterium]